MAGLSELWLDDNLGMRNFREHEIALPEPFHRMRRLVRGVDFPTRHGWMHEGDSRRRDF
jgi:hypothetical protein